MRKLYGERRELATADPPVESATIGPRLVARMLEDGLYGEALSDWTDRSHEGPAILVNFTNIGSQRAAEALGRRILKVMA